jgi:hypothetical protein
MGIDNRELREQLVDLLRGGSAHADVETVLAGFPADKRAIRPDGAPYNAWQLIWHMQFTLHDLLDFCTNAKYLAPRWPAEYWPSEHEPPSDDAWDSAIRGLKADLAAFQKMIMNPSENMYATIPWGDGQTVLREILLAADHTSYHLGQIVLLRKLLDAWSK